MLSLKTNPVGKDWYIQGLQKRLHSELVAAWGISESEYISYGRAYRNRTDNGYKAEVFVGDREYKEVYWDDRYTVVSFFGQSGSEKQGIKAECDIHVVFFVDLAKLALNNKAGSTISHRSDEEVRQTVTRIIGRHSNAFTLMSVDLWLENVLREYDGTIRDMGLKYLDMHPVHCFRLNLKLIYDRNKIC